MKDILPSGVFLLEGKDGQDCTDNKENFVPYHLLIEGTIHPKMAVVPSNTKVFFVEKVRV